MPCKTWEYKLVNYARHCQYARGCGFVTSIKMPRISAVCACIFFLIDSPSGPSTSLIVSCTICFVWDVSLCEPAPKKSSTCVNVRDGAARLIFRLSASPMTAHTMGVTATPKPQVSIIISKETVSMNPINLAVVGCQCS